jgi:hypothetical protein
MLEGLLRRAFSALIFAVVVTGCRSNGQGHSNHKTSAAIQKAVYGPLCQPPFDSAAVAKKGCIMRDQSANTP